MKQTCEKGAIGVAMVISEAMIRGHQVSIPLDYNMKYDLILDRNGKIERVQCKFTVSDGKIIKVRTASNNGKRQHRYTQADIDAIACYDATTKQVYYIPSSVFDDTTLLHLRIADLSIKYTGRVWWAKDFTDW